MRCGGERGNDVKTVVRWVYGYFNYSQSRFIVSDIGSSRVVGVVMSI